MIILVAFLVLVPLFTWLLDREFKRIEEERRLRELFADPAYRAYAERMAAISRAFGNLSPAMAELAAAVTKAGKEFERFGRTLDGK